MCAIGTGRAMLYWSAERRQNDNMVVAFATFLHRGWGNERSGPSGTSLEGKLRARHAHWCVAIAWAIVGSCRRYDVHWPEAFVLFYRGVVVVELLSRCCFGEKGTSGRPPRQKYTSIKMPTQLCMTTNVGIKCAKTLKGVCKDVKGHVQRRKRAAPAQRRCRHRHFFRAGALRRLEEEKRKKEEKREEKREKERKRGKKDRKDERVQFQFNSVINSWLWSPFFAARHLPATSYLVAYIRVDIYVNRY